ncbi:MAG: hypothetical protein ACN0LA_13275 [Candidatus Longimicrobiales bacterium M2_2A_002]
MTVQHPSHSLAAHALPLLATCLLLAATACGGSPTATVPRCGSAPDLVPGDSVDAALGTDSDRFDGAFIDYYTLQLSGPRALRVAQSSSDFDPLLLVFDASGQIIDQAFQEDGSPPGSLETATLTRTFEAGCFLLGASVWDRGDTGGYTLTVRTDTAGAGGT